MKLRKLSSSHVADLHTSTHYCEKAGPVIEFASCVPLFYRLNVKLKHNQAHSVAIAPKNNRQIKNHFTGIRSHFFCFASFSVCMQSCRCKTFDEIDSTIAANLKGLGNAGGIRKKGRNHFDKKESFQSNRSPKVITTSHTVMLLGVLAEVLFEINFPTKTKWLQFEIDFLTPTNCQAYKAMSTQERNTKHAIPSYELYTFIMKENFHNLFGNFFPFHVYDFFLFLS